MQRSIGFLKSMGFVYRLLAFEPLPAHRWASSFNSTAAYQKDNERSNTRLDFRQTPKYQGANQVLGHQKLAYHNYLRTAPPLVHHRPPMRISGDQRFGQVGENRGGFNNPAAFRSPSSGFGGGGLKTIDWNNTTLGPIQKSIYVESQSVANRPKSEVDAWIAENQVTLKGDNIPRPIFEFDEAGFPKEVEELLYRNYLKPTVIQSISWPVALSGRNMISIARTGSGKTLGFILPAILHTLKQERRPPGGGPSVLVILPTRELAQQVQEVAKDYCNVMGLTSTCLFGGAPKMGQLSDLRRGVDLCIATPGRLLDFLESGTTNMSRCTFLVLDEADRMLDMGFEPQIRRVVSQIRKDRQSLMFSATWPNEVRTLAADFQDNPVFLNVGSLELSANPNIEQIVEVVEEHRKEGRLFQLLENMMCIEGTKVIIFVETKRKADDLTYTMRRSGWPALCIHGDKEQRERDWVLSEFKIGRSPILLATDVAARGLDVDDIKAVINFDFPNNSEDYVHRIGRTGRRDKKGLAHSFFTSKDAPKARDLIKVLEEAKQVVPPELLSLSNSGGGGFSGRGAPTRPRYGTGRSGFSSAFDGNSRYGGGPRW